MRTRTGARERGYGFGKAIANMFFASGAVALLVAGVRWDAASLALASYGVAMIIGASLMQILDRWGATRPIGTVKVCVALTNFSTLCLATIIAVDGDYMYGNPWTGAIYSHLTDAPRVVAVTSVFLTSFCVGNLFGSSIPGAMSFSRAVDRLPKAAMLAMLVVAVVFLGARYYLLFWPMDLTPAALYSVRIYVGMFTPSVFFIGMNARRGSLWSYILTMVAAVLSVMTLLAGSRWDAMLPMVFIGLGYALSVPTEMRVMRRWALLAFGLAMLSSFVGQAVREDGHGRTGQAGLARISNLSERLSTSEASSQVLTVTLGRMVSNSVHAIVSQVPDEINYEEDGLINIPLQIANNFLPRFNYSGQSETETPRNWILNDFGFLCSWQSSVDLPMVADAWYRGGWLGIVLIGLVAGVMFDQTERLIWRESTPGKSLLPLLVMINSTPMFIGRDIVYAIRGLTLNMLGALTLTYVLIKIATPPRNSNG